MDEQLTGDELTALVETPDPQAVIEASLYQFDPPTKTKYLSYRACGFTTREAEKLAGINQRTRFRWRETDPRFVIADTSIGSVQKEIANKYLEMEFRRNLRLVMEIDFRVLVKVVQEKEPVLSTREQKWLDRLRQHYTPQQIEAMAHALGESVDGEGFDFTKFVLGLAKGSDRLVIAGSRE